MSGEWWETAPEAGDVLGGVRRQLTGQKWEVVTAEIVSVRGYRNLGKSLSLIVGTGNNEFADVDAVIEGPDLVTIQRFFETQRTSLDLGPGWGLTCRGEWRLADNGSKLVLHVRQIGKNLTKVGPVSRWREAQRAAVVASGNAVHERPHHKPDVESQFSSIRDRLEDRNIVVIGHRKTEGGHDLSKRVQSSVRQKLVYTNQAVQGHTDVIARSIAQRLDSVSSQETALVVIARGGGGAANRVPFDSAIIANSIAACSKREIPVVTALGHTRDTHLADLVAWCSCATPTDAATLLNSIWYADPTPSTPVTGSLGLPSGRSTDADSESDLADSNTTTPGNVAPPSGSQVSQRPKKHAGWVATTTVLFVLLVMLALFVHFFSSSSDTSTHSPSSPPVSPSSRMFLSPSKNILCTGTASTVRCDINTVYYGMKSVPNQCRSTPNWGHVVVLDAEGGRMTCPNARHTYKGLETRLVLPYGHRISVGGATCTSTANYMQCTRGAHGFRVSKEAHKVW